MVEIYERVFETVFDEKQNGYLRSGRLQEVVPTRQLPDTKIQEIYKFLAGKWFIKS